MKDILSLDTTHVNEFFMKNFLLHTWQGLCVQCAIRTRLWCYSTVICNTLLSTLLQFPFMMHVFFYIFIQYEISVTKRRDIISVIQFHITLYPADTRHKHTACTHLVQYKYSYNIPHEQIEGILGWATEVFPMYSTHYVCISIDEFYELFQAPEEAAKTTHDCLHEGIVILLQLVVYIFQYDSNYATYGKNKRTKC